MAGQNDPTTYEIRRFSVDIAQIMSRHTGEDLIDTAKKIEDYLTADAATT